MREKKILFRKLPQLFSGYPTPKIEWQKADARPLSSGNIRQVVCLIIEKEKKELIPIFQGSQLRINRATSQDSGIYKCLGRIFSPKISRLISLDFQRAIWSDS